MDSIDEIMTASEVAAYLKLPPKTIQKLAVKGAIPVVDIGGEYRFKKSVLERWLREQAVAPQTTELALAASPKKIKTVSVADAMRETAVATHLTATTRDDVLRELADLVPVSKHFRQTLFEALKARENLCSTAVGDGVALPHARNAMVGLVSQPIIAFGRHTEGMDFGALDKKPTHLFFLLCAPNVRQHLQLLAQLSRILHDEKVRAALLTAAKPADVLRIIRKAEAA